MDDGCCLALHAGSTRVARVPVSGDTVTEIGRVAVAHPLEAVEQEVEETSSAPAGADSRRTPGCAGQGSRLPPGAGAIKNGLKHSGASISEVLEEGHHNEVIGKMRVFDLLQSMPGSARSAPGRSWSG